VQGQKCPHSQQEIQPRQREEQFSRSHQRLVHPPTVITGDHAHHAANNKSESGSHNTGRDGNLTAVQDTGKLIPAERVGSE